MRVTDGYDVVVVGHGIAGLSAAIAAGRAGARTVVLEKSPRSERGGDTRFSSGGFLTAIEEPTAVRERFDLDGPVARFTAADVREKLHRQSNGRVDPALAEVIATDGFASLCWLHELGVEWERPVREGFGGYGQFDGVLRASGSWGNRGEELVERLAERAAAAGVSLEYETACRDVRTDGTGAVSGVVAGAPSGPVRYETPAVVLCAGSFTASPEMRARYLGPGKDVHTLRGSRHNTGEVLEAALRSGARAAGHWSGAHEVMVDADSPRTEAGQTRVNGFQYGILLNVEGRRFVDEGEDFASATYATFGTAVHEQPDRRAYLLFDDRLAEHVRNYAGTDPVQAPDLESLVAALEFRQPERALETVRSYNAAAGGGDFDPHALDGVAASGLSPPKSNWAVPLEEPPFLCHPVTAALTFTYGGVAVDADARVIGRGGRPMPGLWAAGNVTGGLFYDTYPGGASLTAGAVFGRIAGENAAAHADG